MIPVFMQMSVKKTSSWTNMHSGAGTVVSTSLSDVADSLERKAGWLMEQLCRQEWIDGGTSEG